MTNAAQSLIRSFDFLSDEDKQEVLVQLLRRLSELPSFPLSDEELIRSADEIFQDYDRG